MDQNNQSYDIAIIGSGPAGMSAANTALEYGLSVALIDEQAKVGGQIYRSVSAPVLKDRSILGTDYYAGSTLAERVHQYLKDFPSQFQYFSASMVWSIESDKTICFSCEGQSSKIKARKIILATGAMERASPFPGWTLPGVMTCGSAQILLKQQGLAPHGKIVLAGSGPLLLLIAAQLMRAGIRIERILDTTPKGRLRSALHHFPAALRNLPLLMKGIMLLKEIRLSGTPYESHVSQLHATANSEGLLNKISYQVNGESHQVECDTLLVHQGVIPNVQLSRSLGLAHQWNEQQKCWHPVKDNWGESSDPDIFIAGDGAGIAGAKAAEYQGILAATRIAKQLGKTSSSILAVTAQKARSKLKKELAARPFLDVMYQPEQAYLAPAGDTIVCRCEEVTASEVRTIAQQGVAGPNQTKSFCRSGMGPCQGRICGQLVANIIADEQQRAPEEVGYYQIRSPIKPLRLSELADLDSQ